jgi:hypothetical protein
VSDSPIVLDKERLRYALQTYTIDGRPVFNLADPAQAAYLEKVLRIAEPQTNTGQLDGEVSVESSSLVESRESILKRLKNVRMITDDNMGEEWSR